MVGTGEMERNRMETGLWTMRFEDPTRFEDPMRSGSRVLRVVGELPYCLIASMVATNA